MNILFLTSSLAAGGAERVAATLCNAWAERGDGVRLVPTYSGGGTPFYQLNTPVEIQYLSGLAGARGKSLRSYARRFSALRNLIRHGNVDVVISFLPNVNVAAVLAVAFTGVPVIISERRDPESQRASRFWELACTLLYRFANAVVVQTDTVKASIGGLYPSLKYVVSIPNPLPGEILKKRRQEIATPRRVLLSLGRLSPEKQIDHIIRSFAGLAGEHAEWDLHIYGDGPARNGLEALAVQLGMSDRICFMGRTSEPWSVMESAAAFVMTSRFEGFPNALLEAMGIGLPCVAYDCPSGPREITRGGEDAMLVALNDERQLAEKLAQLMSDEALRLELGARARRSVIDRYQLDAVLRQWDGLFAQLGVGK